MNPLKTNPTKEEKALKLYKHNKKMLNLLFGLVLDSDGKKKPITPLFLNETYYLKENDSLKYTQISRAIRTLHGDLKSRTHNINLIDNTIYWENNNSQEYEYKFNSKEEAAEFWIRYIRVPIEYRDCDDRETFTKEFSDVIEDMESIKGRLKILGQRVPELELYPRTNVKLVFDVFFEDSNRVLQNMQTLLKGIRSLNDKYDSKVS